MLTSLKRLAVGFALVCMTSAAAHAFVVLKKWNSAATTTWSSSTISWRLSTSTMPGIPTKDYEASLQAAFDAWEAVSCSAVNFNYGGFASSDPSDGIFVFVQQNQWDPSVGDAAAFSQSDSGPNGTIYNNIVVFNAVDINWTTANINLSGYSDVQGVVTHEIGHSIGLDHSRHQDATMFFSGGGVDMRSLNPDDEKGACFLYPGGSEPYPGGVSCDTCNSSADCTGGNCWNWGGQFDGHAFCMENCTSTANCPAGFSCVSIGPPQVEPGDPPPVNQCYPDNEYCNQAGSNIALGDLCYGQETCSSGVCLVTSETAFCSKECTSDGQCGGGFVCSSGFCFKSGSKPFGADCGADTECQTGQCIEGLALGTGVCTHTCGSNGGSCPAGSQCLQDLFCVPPGGKPNGTSCLYPTECLSSYCEDGTCKHPCGGGNPSCPAGAQCTSGWCEGAATGGQCQAANECPSTLVCQYPTANAEYGSCGYACQPLAGTATSGCPSGNVCDWVWQSWNSTIAGRCVTSNGGAGVGEPCTSVPCEVDLICHQGIGTTATCHTDCKLQSNSLGCDTGNEKCDDLLQDVNDPQKGICVNKFGNPPGPDPEPQPEPVPDEAAPDTTTTDTTMTPDTATTPDVSGDDTGTSPPDAGPTLDATVGPPDGTDEASTDTFVGTLPPNGGSGSGCGAAGPWSWPASAVVWVWGLGALLWWRRRRHCHRMVL